MALMAGIAFIGRAANPIITSIYTADPSARVWADGRLYLFMPRMTWIRRRGCDYMDRYHVFSTDNLTDWRDVKAKSCARARCRGDWKGRRRFLCGRPDCIYRNGTYYF